ncbi:MAG: hypothetical protein LBV80_02960 [Deltaproteobacteria bacterium]|jgi:hypothetical protein|nr:hypothetical protein [Deltaproteobacteria bacterium]
MKKLTFLLIALMISVSLQGCITTVQGLFDEDFRAQQSAMEVNQLFPEIQGMYSWMNNEFINGVATKLNASPPNLRAGFTRHWVESNAREGFPFVRSESSGWNYNNSSTAAINRNFEVRDEMFIELCKKQNYTVVRYKYDFSKSLLKGFGIESVTGRDRQVDVSWRYTYVAFNENKEPVMGYIPLLYGIYLSTMGGVGNYNLDSIFLPKDKVNSLMNSLPNSFINDMESTTF